MTKVMSIDDLASWIEVVSRQVDIISNSPSAVPQPLHQLSDIQYLRGQMDAILECLSTLNRRVEALEAKKSCQHHYQTTIATGYDWKIQCPTIPYSV